VLDEVRQLVGRADRIRRHDRRAKVRRGENQLRIGRMIREMQIDDVARLDPERS